MSFESAYSIHLWSIMLVLSVCETARFTGPFAVEFVKISASGNFDDVSVAGCCDAILKLGQRFVFDRPQLLLA
jgi:hypothetical protein